VRGRVAAGVEVTGLLLLVTALAGCNRAEEYYFAERVHGRTIGPFISTEVCENTRTALVDNPRATTPCWRGR
jgi:hypothetical protein